MRKLYLKNAVILTGMGILLRLLGMGYRVLLANRLGSEGMGLYQLILSCYMIFVSLATSGLNVASTKLAAQSLARGNGMGATLRSLCSRAAMLGSAAMLAQTLLAHPVAKWILQDVRAELPLKILAPSLPFMAVAGVVRGCFLANRNVTPNAVAQIVEQCIRMAVAMAMLRAIGQWGAQYGCAAVLLGNTVSETCSCLLMLLSAKREPQFRRTENEPLHPYRSKELWEILLPVEGSRVLASGLQAVESGLLPWALTLYLGERSTAVAQFGAVKGMAMPLLLFPFTFLAAAAGMLMPEITRAATRRDGRRVRSLIWKILSFTALFSVLAAAALVLFGADAAQRLYGDGEVGQYVQILGIAAPFMYLETMVDGILKGLGEQLATFCFALLDSAVRIGCIWYFVPRYGIKAFLIIMIASNIMTCALNTARMFGTIKMLPDGSGSR